MINEPKVRVGTEAEDIAFLLDQVENGDLRLAFCLTKSGSLASHLLSRAIDAIYQARAEIRDEPEASIDFAEVRMANGDRSSKQGAQGV